MKEVLQYIFSVKNDDRKTHKIITILGLRLKFRNQKKEENFSSINTGYEISGKNNKIIIVEEDGSERVLGQNEKIEGLGICIRGNNNIVQIEFPSTFCDATLEILNSNNSKIIIHSTPEFWWYVKLAGGEKQIFEFGKGSTISYKGEVHILDSNAGVIIGRDCMFSGQVMIFASDAHTVYDRESKQPLNRVSSIVNIGDHCWIAQGAKLLKNAKIPSRSVVANSSVVTTSFETEHILIAGNPAKVVKNNIDWDRRNVITYERECL